MRLRTFIKSGRMLRLKVCHGCKQASNSTRKCTGCDLAMYCSKQCQKTDWPNHKPVCGKSTNAGDSSKSRCKYCGKNSQNLKRCTRCVAVSYCSKECQTKDWGSHKSSCAGQSKHENKAAPVTGSCRKCGKTGCRLWCSRCKTTFYCSKECQKEDWKNHKVTDCKDKGPSSESKNSNPSEDSDQRQRYSRPFAPFGLPMFFGPGFPFLPPEVVQFEADRPPGSLAKAKAIAQRRFIFQTVIDDLDQVPFESPFPLFRVMQKAELGSILVAFMFKYGEYAARHAIYIKDKKDEVTKVEFYLDFDNPFPFFSYTQVKPGSYLCLLNPLIHVFLDGTVGIRVDEASEVSIIDGRSVT